MPARRWDIPEGKAAKPLPRGPHGSSVNAHGSLVGASAAPHLGSMNKREEFVERTQERRAPGCASVTKITVRRLGRT